jgi:hypothetical protein
MEAKSDQVFLIRCTFGKETRFLGDAMRVEVWMDGVFNQSRVMRRELCQREAYAFSILGVDLDGGQYSPYIFSDLKICR